jgi:hypothetical protein
MVRESSAPLGSALRFLSVDCFQLIQMIIEKMRMLQRTFSDVAFIFQVLPS